jgi:hypothetical protein
MSIMFMKDPEGDVFRISEVASIKLCKSDRRSYVQITMLNGSEWQYPCYSRAEALSLRDTFIRGMDAKVVNHYGTPVGGQDDDQDDDQDDNEGGAA